MTKRHEQLASALRYVAETGRAAGLHPPMVAEAADLLLEQAEEIERLSAALATKQHTVTMTDESDHPYRRTIRGEFVLADPRVFFAEMQVDGILLEQVRDEVDYFRHIAMSLTSSVMEQWRAEVGIKAAVALHELLRPSRDTRRMAETGTGSVRSTSGANSSKPNNIGETNDR